METLVPQDQVALVELLSLQHLETNVGRLWTVRMENAVVFGLSRNVRNAALMTIVA